MRDLLNLLEDFHRPESILDTDPAFAAWFGDGIFKGSGGPIPIFHQTGKQNVDSIKANGFDLGRVEARGTDEQMPDGVFFKFNMNDIGLGHIDVNQRAQMRFYTRAKNPLFVRNRAELSDFLHRDPLYAATIEVMVEDDKRLKHKFEEAEKATDFAERNEGNREARNQAYKNLDELLRRWRKVERENAAKARHYATKFLKAEGYDSLVMEQDAGGFRQAAIKTLVVFDPADVKLASQKTLDEKFEGGFKGDDGPVEVYSNPSRVEFAGLLKPHGAVRGFLDGAMMYAWDGYIATHENVDTNMGLWGQRFEIFASGSEGRYYTGGQLRMVLYWNYDYENPSYPDGHSEFESFDAVKAWVLQLPCIKRLGLNLEIEKG
jgi:hypothetical protein